MYRLSLEVDLGEMMSHQESSETGVMSNALNEWETCWTVLRLPETASEVLIQLQSQLEKLSLKALRKSLVGEKSSNEILLLSGPTAWASLLGSLLL